MRKIVFLFFAWLFMAVPVMAASNVTITCTNTTVAGDPNWVLVSYATDHNRIRAFGLDLKTDVNGITDVNFKDYNSNYRIFPGRINFVNGDVNSYGTPYDPCSLGYPDVAIEMGSLYTTDSNYSTDANAGYNMIPGTSGNLLRFHVNTDGNSDCNYTVDVNMRRGGIVMEDPYENPATNLPRTGTVAGCTPVPSTCTVPLEFNVTPTQAGTDMGTQCPCLVWGTSQGGEVNCVVTNGNVTRTVPPAGTVATCGSTVNYWVAANPPAPGAASSPTPAAGAKCVALNATLNWTPGANTSTQDVYFGTASTPPLVASGIAGGTVTYNPGAMAVYTLYRWRIDEKNACGTTTTGTVWCFTTGPSSGVACCSNEAWPCLGDVNGVHDGNFVPPWKPPPGDGYVRLGDVTSLISFVGSLSGSLHRCATGVGSTTCPPCYDIDGDGYVRLSDVTALISKVGSFPGSLHRHTCPYPSCSNP